ncbi:hypothetical protein [Nonomuraea rhodomycinica]|uniref:Uncharacterized protein n=1 Tax=Nonomuraea rhodomycinica TaxID=1712872 RepID=A0A7Y6ISG2_9ACTN|nr:hypothetical protein [Nonomuraea rhodomycinica]NUW42309.1 hypothetical protein [Nonomuraea rhodomycinica]
MVGIGAGGGSVGRPPDDDAANRRIPREVSGAQQPLRLLAARSARIDVGIASVVHGHVITGEPEARVFAERGRRMPDRFAELDIVRHQPRLSEYPNERCGQAGGAGAGGSRQWAP